MFFFLLLQVLYLGNNQSKSFDELLKIKDLPALQVLYLEDELSFALFSELLATLDLSLPL